MSIGYSQDRMMVNELSKFTITRGSESRLFMSKCLFIRLWTTIVRSVCHRIETSLSDTRKKRTHADNNCTLRFVNWLWIMCNYNWLKHVRLKFYYRLVSIIILITTLLPHSTVWIILSYGTHHTHCVMNEFFGFVFLFGVKKVHATL